MRRLPLLALVGCSFVIALSTARDGRSGDPWWSDPASVPAPPSGAVGFPDRSPNLDVLPGFRSPPPGYGEVAFYWWLGDPLTKERLAWQLEQLSGKGVMGLQINYAHSDQGGRSYGLTFPSDPPLFSDAWWKLVGWFMQEAKQRGMAVSLSDYTLGIGQGWKVDELLRERPDLTGSVLQAETRDVGGGDIKMSLPICAHRCGIGNWNGPLPRANIRSWSCTHSVLSLRSIHCIPIPARLMRTSSLDSSSSTILVKLGRD
jgi:hypothetical protein